MTLLLAVLAGAVHGPGEAKAQIVSPGRLSTAHAELEGIRNCTECHVLGQPGAARDRCLACHTPLARRIADGRGYHGRLRRDCAACHREHLGRDAALVRLDTAAFRHEDAGYELRGAHATLGCRSCHRPALVRAADVRAYRSRPDFLARTRLGLPVTCAGCHATDSPHGDQFGARGCDVCHGEERWDGAERFDHAGAAFRLTGRHVDVACADCHVPAGGGGEAKYAGLAYASCAACHGDPHQGAMRGACRDCHTTEGWGRVRAGTLEGRFDHDRTGFPLTGRHARLDCGACHRPTGGAGIRVRFRRGTERWTYPRPEAETCSTCHVDPHRGEVVGRCESCHRDTGWTPTTYGLEQHRRSDFPLEGAHAAVPCDGCHRGPAVDPGLRLRPPATCAECHQADDPHGGLYGDRPCGSCHRPTGFTDVAFDHEGVEAGSCRSCHRQDDPHGDQFGTEACDACHVVATFRIAAFDHDGTDFPLRGPHAEATCGACHRTERGAEGRVFVRYRPVSGSCRDCHGGGE